ncbi:Vacuolar iron transporter 1 [Cladobotryum mycophilum]|uniref:Vacuolar iron transporter 1 n=1 Tax=Cladobotryum mycophilum TaxID=491253 RepID=A0ABR0SL27_9HYPO
MPPYVPLFEDDDTRWQAVQARDSSADGFFVYGVRTTKIFCRPICKARLARRANVRFYGTVEEAKEAGFRACKRCKPEVMGLMPEEAAVQKIRAFVRDREAGTGGGQSGGQDARMSLSQMARRTGLSKWHFHRVFKKCVGVTPFEYLKMARDQALSAATAGDGDDAAADILRDVIIGFSDGLTVPFALTAGLSSLGSSKIVIMGGLAELFSGMISMGLGAYLAAVTERDHYQYEEEKQQLQLSQEDCLLPQEQRDDIFCILEKYSVSRAAAAPLVDELCKNREQWVRFRMDFSLRLEKPNIHRAWISGLTMGLSYFVGGLIPMVPYFVMERVREALIMSIAVTVVILLGFGYVKNYVAIRNHRAGLWGAIQTLIIGVLAAGTSYVIVKALDQTNA